MSRQNPQPGETYYLDGLTPIVVESVNKRYVKYTHIGKLDYLRIGLAWFRLRAQKRQSPSPAVVAGNDESAGSDMAWEGCPHPSPLE